MRFGGLVGSEQRYETVKVKPLDPHCRAEWQFKDLQTCLPEVRLRVLRGAALSDRQPHSRQECERSSCYVWSVGRSGPKDNAHLFSQVLRCHTPRHTLTLPEPPGPPALGSVVSALLIFLTSANYTAQKMKRGGGGVWGSRRGLVWLGGRRGAASASPLTGCPLPLCSPDNEPFWGPGPDQLSHLTPGLTWCLSGAQRREQAGDGEEGTMGFTRATVSQRCSTGCRQQAEASGHHRKPLFQAFLRVIGFSFLERHFLSPLEMCKTEISH